MGKFGKTNAGKFLSNFVTAAAGGDDFQKFHSKDQGPAATEARIAKENKTIDDRENLSAAIGIADNSALESGAFNPYGGAQVGGGFPRMIHGEDNTDTTSNMSKAYMKKKGY